LEPESCQDLVLYQAIVQRVRPSRHPVMNHRKPEYSGAEICRLKDLNPDIQHLFKKLHCRISFQNDWWSAFYADKGMIIDTFA